MNDLFSTVLCKFKCVNIAKRKTIRVVCSRTVHKFYCLEQGYDIMTSDFRSCVSSIFGFLSPYFLLHFSSLPQFLSHSRNQF